MDSINVRAAPCLSVLTLNPCVSTIFKLYQHLTKLQRAKGMSMCCVCVCVCVCVCGVVLCSADIQPCTQHKDSQPCSYMHEGPASRDGVISLNNL